MDVKTSYCSPFFGLFIFFSFVRLAVRMKLLFIAAVNHVYYCNSWRPTRPHNPTGFCCDWRCVYGEDMFAKGHLYFLTEFTTSAKLPDVAVSRGLLWRQKLPTNPSRLSLRSKATCCSDRQHEMLQHNPSAWSVLLAWRLWLYVTEKSFCSFPWV